MCGIAGIVRTGNERVALDELDRMVGALTRRGPDGQGVWSDRDLRVALGHTRLAVIDLSERGRQPMASASGNLVVTFNGEVFNHQQLRQELEREGWRFESTSDTEVLLALYERDGVGMLGHLRGMYAFAIWDERKGELFLARDPQGIKPLYYSTNGGYFRFASQVKALVAGGRLGRTIDPVGAVGFLCFGSVPEPYTIRQGILALSAGSYLVLRSDGSLEERKHFDLAECLAATLRREHGQGHSRDGALAAVRAALKDSVRHHLVSDVPVGIFLSAGIDSGALLGLVREEGTSVVTLTAGFPAFRGTKGDEVPSAAEVARNYGADHHARWLDDDDIRASADDVLEAMDQPSVDGVNTWLISRCARELGLKVVLSGLGADEIFGGYPSFRDVPRLARLPAVKVETLRGAYRRFATSLVRHGVVPRPKATGLAEYAGTYEGAYFLRRGLFLPWELEDAGLFPRDLVRAGLESFSPLAHIRERLRPDPYTPGGRVAALEGALYMRNQLLRDSDWASMWHGLELRVPFVDVPLLRSIAPFGLAKPFGKAKRVLAETPTPPLPVHVAQRPKTGFSVPMDTLLHGDRAPLQRWRSYPALCRPGVHWSRKFAGELAARLADQV